MDVCELCDQFFADLKSPDAARDREKALSAWLWFTCPAERRGEVECAIRADARWQKKPWMN